VPFFHIDLQQLIITVGYLGLFAIVFAESGLFFGFFLPGDSLLITSGLLASQGYLNIVVLVFLLSIAAISGDSVGYWFGRKVGPRIFKKENSLLFNKKHLIEARKFYEKHGGKTIYLARFMPFIRTFAPIVAGVGKMHYPRFLFFNVTGGISWIFGISLLGYFLGSSFPEIDKYIIQAVAIIVFLSVLPGLIHQRKSLLRGLRKVFRLEDSGID